MVIKSSSGTSTLRSDFVPTRRKGQYGKHFSNSGIQRFPTLIKEFRLFIAKHISTTSGVRRASSRFRKSSHLCCPAVSRNSKVKGLPLHSAPYAKQQKPVTNCTRVKICSLQNCPWADELIHTDHRFLPLARTVQEKFPLGKLTGDKSSPLLRLL